MSEASPSQPNILLIPDGSRRWSRLHSVSEEETYQLGTKRVVELAAHLGALGFSEFWVALARPFNFTRHPKTIKAILEACLLIDEVAVKSRLPLNVTVGGRLNALPPGYAERFRTLEDRYRTGAFTTHILLGWSNELEIRDLAFSPASQNVTELKPYLLDISPIKKPIDLIIRTGSSPSLGRVSELMPLHSQNAEICFSTKLFPDYKAEDLQAALATYADRYPANLP